MNNAVKEPHVLYDARGKKSHVVLPIKAYQELLERLEDAEDIKAIKAVEHEKAIPWSEVKKRLHKKN
jgi:hypothetical protein